MPLIDLNGILADNKIPESVSRDTEVTAAINTHVSAGDPHAQYLTQSEGDIRYPVVSTRSGNTVVNANTISFPNFYSIKWIDGITANTNLPTNSGGLKQVDFLFGTAQEGLYTSQDFEANSIFWKRTKNNGTWGSWAQLWTSLQGTPVWQTPSDKGLKRNIRPIKSALNLILESQPVSFEFNSIIKNSDFFGEQYQRQKVHYGFIAQDFPFQDLVSEKSNGYLGIDYVEIIPFLVKAIQELSDEIQKLNNLITQ